MSSRDEYLKSWVKYPQMPAQSEFSGRVVLVNSDSIHLQISESESKEIRGNFRYLSEGDLISIYNNQITLLAPSLKEVQASAVDPKTLMLWSEFLQKVREFFATAKFLEVQTPTLVVCPGTEPFLDAFSTEFSMGSRRQKLYLPTSPELHLKKMLAQGYRKIFEIKPCFRNGEISPTHQPEFMMLEWYRAYSNLDEIEADLIELTKFLAREFQKSIPAFKKHTLHELFKSIANFDLQPGTPENDFEHIYVEKVEPNLPKNALLVHKYPPSQAALARLTEDGWGDRFEFYWKGFEIANAFHELNDPKIQRQRFQEDLEKKRKLGKEILPLDEDFLNALESGMPPSGGIALGLERLFMALFDLKNIQELKNFPYK